MKYLWIFASIMYIFNAIVAILIGLSNELTVLYILGVAICYGIYLLETIVKKLDR